MSTKLKSVFFIFLALYVTVPLLWVYLYLDPLPSFIFLTMPLLYFFLAMVGWNETAHECFRVILFFVLVTNTVVIYHTLFWQDYTNIEAEIVDKLPLDLMLHGTIAGLVFSVLILVLLRFKVGKIPRGERSVIGIFTLVLFAVSLKNLMI